MLQAVGEGTRYGDLPEEIVAIILHSRRDSTRSQYKTYLNRWNQFCSARNYNPVETSVAIILNYLHDLYTQGLGYSTLNTARSTLSAFVMLKNSDASIGSHPLVTRYLKGVFNLNPPVPRYKQIWDTRAVFNVLRTWGPSRDLDLKKLTLRLCILLALLGATRTQFLKALRVDKIEMSKDRIVLRVDELMKTDGPGKVGHELKLSAYPVDRRLCVVRTLKQYLVLTQPFRGEHKQLFLSLKMPHGPVSKDTIARWIRDTLVLAGIDVNIFKAHSVRTASVSAASASFVPVNDIMQRAGWTQEKTFRKFYKKPILPTAQNTFERAILNAR